MEQASGKRGVPQGGVISPLLSNIYLNEVDKMLERAKGVTRTGKWDAVEYARFADDLVVLVDYHPRHQWLRSAIAKRLREKFSKLGVEVNEEKTRVVDLAKGESFGFLGFQIRLGRTRAGKPMPLRMPQLKKRTALLRELKEIFQSSQSQPVQGVIVKINPMLRGWVNYFAIGNASRCFTTCATGSSNEFGDYWLGHVSVEASAGSGGVTNGCTIRSGSIMSTTSSTTDVEAAPVR